LFFIIIILLLSFLIIYFAYSSQNEKVSKEASEKENKQLKSKVKILQNNICPNCKRIYTHSFDERVGFDENMRECFSVVDELSDKEGVVYQLE
jgi:hypothetical protein